MGILLLLHNLWALLYPTLAQTFSKCKDSMENSKLRAISSASIEAETHWPRGDLKVIGRTKRFGPRRRRFRQDTRIGDSLTSPGRRALLLGRCTPSHKQLLHLHLQIKHNQRQLNPTQPNPRPRSSRSWAAAGAPMFSSRASCSSYSRDEPPDRAKQSVCQQRPAKATGERACGQAAC